jgi:ABC-type lipoprotein export system ATPase subunit
MTTPIVELRDVFCVHRTNEGDAAALQGADLHLAPGEVLCVLGPSGAGKSTLLRVIAGLQTPSAGMANVLGRDIGRMPQRARARFRNERLGFLAQHAETALSPDLRAQDAVTLPLALRGVAGRARKRRAAELLDAVGLTDRCGALPAELSGGERQRVALCAAVAHHPALLLADEPTGELDRSSAAAVRALITEVARAQGASVVLVSHDAETADAADRAVVIRDGRIVEERRRGEVAAVVGRDGWVRLGSGLRAQAGIAGHARIDAAPGGLRVTPAHAETWPISPEEQVAPGATSAPPRPVGVDWLPARVELRGLTRGFGRGDRRRQVIDGLTHSFAPGVLTAVTGPSGTGKTTLLRLVAGLDRSDSGLLAIDGEPLAPQDDEALATLRRRRIGYLPQAPAAVGFLSATENIVLALRVRGQPADQAAARAAMALNRVGLSGRARQRVQRLSAGETQRVALARALAAAGGLLLVDEPTSRLDHANAGVVADLLSAAARDDGQTVICATHDPAVIRRAEQVLRLG